MTQLFVSELVLLPPTGQKYSQLSFEVTSINHTRTVTVPILKIVLYSTVQYIYFASMFMKYFSISE